MEVRKEWLEKDYYRLLGVTEAASDKDITRAYRKLARELHPDANPDDPSAEDRFKEVSAAYDILGDAERRSQYDEVRKLGPMAGGFPSGGGRGGMPFDFGEGADISDLLGGLFGGRGGHFGGGAAGRPMKGRDQETQIVLDFDEAVNGVTTSVRISGGSDRGGRDLKVRIPAGMDDGQRIRLAGKGGAGHGGGPPGDLFVVVRVRPHPMFGRDGANLTVEVPITFAEAALGADIPIPTFEGDFVTLRVPPGTQPGRTFRVRGRGVATRKSTGDLLVKVNIAVPTRLNKAQKAALEAFAEANHESPRPDVESDA